MKKDISLIPSNRLQKMRLKLFNYEIELRYLPGKKMCLADLLSRNYLPESYEKEINIEGIVHCINRYNTNYNQLYNIPKATSNDLVLSKVIEYSKAGWPNKKNVHDNVKQYYNIRNEIYLDNRILYFNNRIIIPSELRKLMLQLLHESHQGITKTKLRAKNIFYWPGMMNEIEDFVSSCKVCEKFRASNKNEPLIPHELPNLPYEKVGADILTYNDVDYLVVIDYFSKWIDLAELKYKTASEVINKLKNIFAIHGIPKLLISDNMPFLSSEFQNFAKLWNFKSITTSPRDPRSNGEAEKAVHIAKQIIRKNLEEGKDLYISLLEYRSTVIPGMDVSPSEMLMSRLLRTKLPGADVKLKPVVQHNVKEKLLIRQNKYKQYHDTRAKIRPVDYVPGQSITIRTDNKWVPGKVMGQATTPRSYFVRNSNNETIRRNSYHLRPSLNKPIIYNRDVDVTNVDENNDNVNSCDKQLPNVTNTNVTNLYTTRVGRTVNKPVKFKDYVL